jgi:hypothetical protein
VATKTTSTIKRTASCREPDWPPSAAPPFLYRYLDADRAKEILSTRKIYFCAPASFNDPFDCRVRPRFAGSASEYKRVAALLARQRSPYASRQARRGMVKAVRSKLKANLFENLYRDWETELLDKSGMLCLSEAPDDILMWSHYSKGHSGVCMAFEYRMGDRPFGHAIPIKYADTLPEFNFPKIFSDVHGQPIAIQSEALVRFGEFVFLTKASQWKYEKEWRVIDFPTDGRARYGLRSFSEHSLTGVILGCRMREEQRRDIVKLVRSHFSVATLSEATPSDSQFALDIRRLNP